MILPHILLMLWLSICNEHLQSCTEVVCIAIQSLPMYGVMLFMKIDWVCAIFTATILHRTLLKTPVSALYYDA